LPDELGEPALGKQPGVNQFSGGSKAAKAMKRPDVFETLNDTGQIVAGAQGWLNVLEKESSKVALRAV
jgi:hypothetical protein